MGGAAFRSVSAPGEPTMNIQRLTPETYQRLKSLYLDRIKQCLGSGSEVIALTESPEKQDHGDIDILIASNSPIDLLELARGIGASGIISETKIKCHLAVAQDGARSLCPPIVYHRTDHPSEETTVEPYAQLDIDVIAREDLEWNAFYQSYGGVGALIGMMVSPLGFTMSTSRGFLLTLKEYKLVIDLKLTVPHEEAIIVLSKDPKRVMRYLHLSYDEYQRGFETVEDLYAWAGACRLLCRETLAKHPDRRERRQRPAYETFRNEWVPAHILPKLRADSTEDERLAFIAGKRDAEVQLAVMLFGLQNEYQVKQMRLVQEVDIAAAAQLIRQVVMQEAGLKAGSSRLTKTMRGIKRGVGARLDGVPFTLSAPVLHNPGLQLRKLLTDDRRGFRDPEAVRTEAVRQYMMHNWEDLKELG
nr:hypothetical protein CFP56_30780 [Quercus suber]